MICQPASEIVWTSGAAPWYGQPPCVLSWVEIIHCSASWAEGRVLRHAVRLQQRQRGQPVAVHTATLPAVPTLGAFQAAPLGSDLHLVDQETESPANHLLVFSFFVVGVAGGEERQQPQRGRAGGRHDRARMTATALALS